MVSGFIRRLDSRVLSSTFKFTYPPGHPRGSGLRQMRTRDMVLQLIAEDLQHRGEINAEFGKGKIKRAKILKAEKFGVLGSLPPPQKPRFS